MAGRGTSVFISYRRQDTSGLAGLTDRFGADHVFMDVGSIAPGDDFRKRSTACWALRMSSWY